MGGMKEGRCKVCQIKNVWLHGAVYSTDTNEQVGTCSACFETIAVMMDTYHIPYFEAYRRVTNALKATAEKNASEDGTVVYRYATKEGKQYSKRSRPIESLVVTRILTPEYYQSLEYDFLDLDEDPEFEDPKDAVRYYRELIDAALAGGDYEWAGSLHKQLMIHVKQGEGQVK
jgi:hypothetical protein